MLDTSRLQPVTPDSSGNPREKTLQVWAVGSSAVERGNEEKGCHRATRQKRHMICIDESR